MERTWRFEKSEYSKLKFELLHNQPSVLEWYDYSKSLDRTETELIVSSFASIQDCDSYICLAYACQNGKFTDEFLEDLIYVNTGLVIPGDWNPEVYKYVMDLYHKIPENQRNFDVTKDIMDLINNPSNYNLPDYYIKHFTDIYNVRLASKKGSVWNMCSRLMEYNKKFVKDYKEIFENYYTKNTDMVSLYKQAYSNYKTLMKAAEVLLDAYEADDKVAAERSSRPIAEAAAKLKVKLGLLTSYIDECNTALDDDDKKAAAFMTRKLQGVAKSLNRTASYLVNASADPYDIRFYVSDRLDWVYISEFQPNVSRELIEKCFHSTSIAERNAYNGIDSDECDEEEVECFTF